MSLKDQSELHDTELGLATVHATESLEKHMKAFIVGGIAVIVVIAGIIAVASSGRGASEAGWSRFAEASSASDFANVASDFPGTEVAIWARLREAEIQLGESIQLQFTDRAAANSQLKKSGDAFDSVIEKAASLPEAKERALLGKARVLEATSDGDLSKAIDAYKVFAQGFPQSVWAEQVNARIKTLESRDASEFYAWFSKQNPRPEDRPNPRDGLPPGHPEIPVTLPPIPDELVPADWSEIDVEDAAAAPTTEAAPNVDASTAAEKPATPAEPEKPKPE
ncbi:hypothetical protein GC176_25590 [bacterium]|nr:hypothetical protein [bacterium]